MFGSGKESKIDEKWVIVFYCYGEESILRLTNYIVEMLEVFKKLFDKKLRYGKKIITPYARFRRQFKFDEGFNSFWKEMSLPDFLADVEASVLIHALAETGGSFKGTAKILGINERQLRYRLSKLEKAGYDLREIKKISA